MVAISEQLTLRPPDDVMRLERMGAFFATRLSFMRTLIRRLGEEQADVRRVLWEIDDAGFGRAVYALELGGNTYSLVAFATPLADHDRTDRVIAQAWDTSYVLYDGIATAQDLDRLAINVPKQEAGRFEQTDLILSRANKSVRLFAHVIDALSNGVQPDHDAVLSIGYLMRTTAVYGNGKFGIADRHVIADRPGLEGPFQAEMLTVWLIRGFTIDLVEHIARAKNPNRFQPLGRHFKRYLGIGNATGLGMAPFLVSHPLLINNWMVARETALAKVCAIARASPATIRRGRQLLARARRHVAQWNVDDTRQMARIVRLRRELAELARLASTEWLSEPYPWRRLVEASRQLSCEGQELVVALVLEPNGRCIDGLAAAMTSPTVPVLDPTMQVACLIKLLDVQFDWALRVDLAKPAATEQFWYVSEDKLEPRLGNRYHEPGAELALPLDNVVRFKAVRADLQRVAARGSAQSVAQFLKRHPEHRYIVRRIQAIQSHPYAEIRDNLTDRSCLAIDMLRCKLSFFGAVKFDPKSDRWTRITLFQGAPLFDELADRDIVDDWWMPVLEA